VYYRPEQATYHFKSPRNGLSISEKDLKSERTLMCPKPKEGCYAHFDKAYW